MLSLSSINARAAGASLRYHRSELHPGSTTELCVQRSLLM